MAPLGERQTPHTKIVADQNPQFHDRVEQEMSHGTISPFVVVARPSHRRPISPLLAYLHDHDLPCRQQCPQEDFQGLGRDLENPEKRLTGHARHARLGDDEGKPPGIGNFRGAVFEPFGERGEGHRGR